MENKIYLKSRNFPFIRLSCPPSREYKQSMAMQASPPPNPLKRKLKQKRLSIEWDHWKFKEKLKI